MINRLERWSHFFGKSFKHIYIYILKKQTNNTIKEFGVNWTYLSKTKKIENVEGVLKYINVTMKSMD